MGKLVIKCNPQIWLPNGIYPTKKVKLEIYIFILAAGNVPSADYLIISRVVLELESDNYEMSSGNCIRCGTYG